MSELNTLRDRQRAEEFAHVAIHLLGSRGVLSSAFSDNHGAFREDVIDELIEALYHAIRKER